MLRNEYVDLMHFSSVPFPGDLQACEKLTSEGAAHNTGSINRSRLSASGRLRSVQSHQQCQSHLDELFILVDRLQSAADIAGDFRRAALLDP